MSIKKETFNYPIIWLINEEQNLASYCVMCITLVELPFTIGNCDKQHM